MCKEVFFFLVWCNEVEVFGVVKLFDGICCYIFVFLDCLRGEFYVYVEYKGSVMVGVV